MHAPVRMAVTVSLVVPPEGPPSLAFPQRCVNCAGPKDCESRLVVTRLVVDPDTGEQAPVTATSQVPHCRACARATRAQFLATILPFLLGFLVVGVIVFGRVGLAATDAGLDEVGRSGSPNALILGAAAGLAAGLAAGAVCEALARVLLLPIVGRSILTAPWLVSSIVSDADHVAGLTGRPDTRFTRLTLTFTNDDVAREFAAANARHVEAAPDS